VRSLGFAAHEQGRKQLVSIIMMKKKYVQRQQKVEGLEGVKGTYGRLLSLLEQFTRAALLELQKFNEHTMFLLCEPDKCVLRIPQEDNSEPTTSLVIPMSSENLLLNAYRQQTSTFPAFTMIDTTHRLIV
jgi:hypothetical protein